MLPIKHRLFMLALLIAGVIRGCRAGQVLTSLSDIEKQALMPDGYCEKALVFAAGPNKCPDQVIPMFDAPNDMCCAYCAPALILSDGSKLCPSPTNPTATNAPLFLPSTSGNLCCTSDKFLESASTPAPGGRGGGTSRKCVDLSAPGRPSDCPKNKHRCDDPIWVPLMTEQCPKTCNRCGQASQAAGTTTTTTCKDGVGRNGTSDCPDRKFLCDDPIWKEFMKKECPKTCGVCTTTTTTTKVKRENDPLELVRITNSNVFKRTNTLLEPIRVPNSTRIKRAKAPKEPIDVTVIRIDE